MASAQGKGMLAAHKLYLTLLLDHNSERPSHTTIQAVPLPWTFRQVNSRKRSRLNVYTPPSTSQTKKAVHTSITFAARRDGSMRVSGRHLIGQNSATIPSTSPAVCEDPSFDFLEADDHFTMDGVITDDMDWTQKRKRTIGVSLITVTFFYISLISP